MKCFYNLCVLSGPSAHRYPGIYIIVICGISSQDQSKHCAATPAPQARHVHPTDLICLGTNRSFPSQLTATCYTEVWDLMSVTKHKLNNVGAFEAKSKPAVNAPNLEYLRCMVLLQSSNTYSVNKALSIHYVTQLRS